jgi:uncharacterized protein YebE (UPF0316 family)
MSAITSNPWLMVATIFIINIVYVSALTMRMLLTMKGYRYAAASVGVLEILVYVVGLGLVLNSLDQIQNVIAYALGFGAGIIVGMRIEEKIALGYLVINVTTAQYEADLPKTLRELGYGVTHYAAKGRDGDRMVMQILTPRRFERKLIETIKQLDEKAFIIAYEPKTINGGFWIKGVQSNRLRAYDTDEV